MQDFRANEAETVSGQVQRSDVSFAAYVGLEVHKDTIAVAVTPPGRVIAPSVISRAPPPPPPVPNESRPRSLPANPCRPSRPQGGH